MRSSVFVRRVHGHECYIEWSCLDIFNVAFNRALQLALLLANRLPGRWTSPKMDFPSSVLRHTVKPWVPIVRLEIPVYYQLGADAIMDLMRVNLGQCTSHRTYPRTTSMCSQYEYTALSQMNASFVTLLSSLASFLGTTNAGRLRLPLSTFRHSLKSSLFYGIKAGFHKSQYG